MSSTFVIWDCSKNISAIIKTTQYSNYLCYLRKLDIKQYVDILNLFHIVYQLDSIQYFVIIRCNKYSLSTFKSLATIVQVELLHFARWAILVTIDGRTDNEDIIWKSLTKEEPRKKKKYDSTNGCMWARIRLRHKNRKKQHVLLFTIHIFTKNIFSFFCFWHT